MSACCQPEYLKITQWPWASYQIHKIAGCACAGNAGNVFSRRRFQRKPLVSDPGMHHDTCVTHVPWCMSGSLTCSGGENVPGIPGACAPAILRIWQEAHGENLTMLVWSDNHRENNVTQSQMVSEKYAGYYTSNMYIYCFIILFYVCEANAALVLPIYIITFFRSGNRNSNVWHNIALYFNYTFVHRMWKGLAWQNPKPTWWRHQMETFAVLLAICVGNSPVTGEFIAQRPVTRSFDVFFDLRMNKRLSKESWGWRFGTPSRPLWRHSNESHFHSTPLRRFSLYSSTFSGKLWNDGYALCLEQPLHHFWNDRYALKLCNSVQWLTFCDEMKVNDFRDFPPTSKLIYISPKQIQWPFNYLDKHTILTNFSMPHKSH